MWPLLLGLVTLLWIGSWQERRALLATYAECQRSSVWRGRYTEPQPLALPRYLYPDEEGLQ